MEIIYKIATPHDLDPITELAEIFGFAIGTDVSPTEFVLAMQQNKIVGFCRLQPRGEVFELSYLGVTEGARRQGIGQALVQEQNRRAGGHPIYLNTIIPEYFEKLGFRTITKAIPDFLEIDAELCGDCPKERCRAMLFEASASPASLPAPLPQSVS